MADPDHKADPKPIEYQRKNPVTKELETIHRAPKSTGYGFVRERILKIAFLVGISHFSEEAANMIPMLLLLQFCPMVQSAIFIMEGAKKKILQTFHFKNKESMEYHISAPATKKKKKMPVEASASSSSSSSSAATAQNNDDDDKEYVPGPSADDDDWKSEEETEDTSVYTDEKEDKKEEVPNEVELMFRAAAGEDVTIPPPVAAPIPVSNKRKFALSHLKANEKQKKLRAYLRHQLNSDIQDDSNLLLSVSGADKFISSIQEELKTDVSVSREVKRLISEMATASFTEMMERAERYRLSLSFKYSSDKELEWNSVPKGKWLTPEHLLNSILVSNPKLWNSYLKKFGNRDYLFVGNAGTKDRPLADGEASRIEREMKVKSKLYVDTTAVVEDEINKQKVVRKNLNVKRMIQAGKTMAQKAAKTAFDMLRKASKAKRDKSEPESPQVPDPPAPAAASSSSSIQN